MFEKEGEIKTVLANKRKNSTVGQTFSKSCLGEFWVVKSQIPLQEAFFYPVQC